MRIRGRNLKVTVAGKWFFLAAFISSCFLFWWLPSFLFRFVVQMADPVEDEILATSFFALALFIAGYLLPARVTSRQRIPETLTDTCENLAYKATVLLFVPALPVAIVVWHSVAGGVGEMGGHIPGAAQALLYTHLFFGFMFFGAARPEKDGWRRVVIAVLLVTLPRLIISLHGGRFFLAQAVVPAVLISIARGWLRFSAVRIVQIAALALAIIFVPAITRGGADLSGSSGLVDFIAGGSSLRLFQDNQDLNLNGRCPPLFVSITAKTIPYSALGVCVLDDFAGLKNLPATAGRIITDSDPGSFHGTTSGTGSNYLIELYLAGGNLAIFAGSAVFGFSCRRFIGWIGRRSLFSGIWAECLTRALFAPRGELGYVFERIPSLVLASLAVVLLVWLARLLQIDYAGGRRAGTPLLRGAQ